ncbi:hypothetical protein IFO70_09735 [Phormidium tenue FACHB-886]|nr:hypothetical protein [Phormidium tenue FACHB-886]
MLSTFAALLRLWMGCRELRQPDSPNALLIYESKRTYKRQRRKRSC